MPEKPSSWCGGSGAVLLEVHPSGTGTPSGGAANGGASFEQRRLIVGIVIPVFPVLFSPYDFAVEPGTNHYCLLRHRPTVFSFFTQCAFQLQTAGAIFFIHAIYFSSF
jgi:hypothetical protein